jgi:hypothetical protein
MLMPDQDQLDVGVLADVAYEVQRVARKAEEMLHAFGLQGLGNGPPDGSARHGRTLL